MPTNTTRIVLTFIIVFYVSFVLAIYPYISPVARRFAYYNLLIDSFLHGRVSVTSEMKHDLSSYNDKLYLYWGPAPVLFILPFYVAGGLLKDDVTYTFFAGFLNLIIFYLLVKEVVRHFKIKLSSFNISFILISFAFISPNFFLSFGGRIWHTSQLVSLLYLLTSFLFCFVFLRSKRIVYFFLATILFNLAWLSRYILIFYTLFYLYPLVILYREKQVQLFRKVLLILSVTFTFSLIFFGTYNYLRFRNPIETGLRYHFPNASPRYRAIQKNNEIFSLKYIPHNINTYVFNFPTLSLQFPFLNIDYEGNSIFIIYPILLTLPWLLRTKTVKHGTLFLSIAWSIIGMYSLLVITYFATGYTQFGSRYFMDLVPLVYLSLLFFVHRIPKFVKVLIMLFGVSLQIWGTILFYSG